MAPRIKPLSRADYDALMKEMEDLERRTAVVGNVIGPAFGAAWCDRALKITRKVCNLTMQIKDRFYDQEILAGRDPGEL